MNGWRSVNKKRIAYFHQTSSHRSNEILNLFAWGLNESSRSLQFIRHFRSMFADQFIMDDEILSEEFNRTAIETNLFTCSNVRSIGSNLRQNCSFSRRTIRNRSNSISFSMATSFICCWMTINSLWRRSTSSLDDLGNNRQISKEEKWSTWMWECRFVVVFLWVDSEHNQWEWFQSVDQSRLTWTLRSSLVKMVNCAS